MMTNCRRLVLGNVTKPVVTDLHQQDEQWRKETTADFFHLYATLLLFYFH